MYWIGTHDFFNFPVALQRFDHVNRPFHNALNVGEVKLISSESIGAGKAFSLGLILLAAICKGKRFVWHTNKDWAKHNANTVSTEI
jgi:hypothetical protein